MNKLILVLIAFLGLSTGSLNAQLLLSDADYDANNPLDCAGIVPGGGAGTNFDDGFATYPANYTDTIVFCPDLVQGSKVSIAFATNIGFTWNVDGTDTLYIYDGPDTSSPLIGAYNSDTNPPGFFVQASWNNPSGCLTLRFVSDGATENTGWDANVACGNPQQPFEPHIEAYINGIGSDALNPLDTGFVDVCFGDSILFIAKPDFPNAYEVNLFGYSQTPDNCTYDWTIGGVGQFTNDSLWFTPPARAGYFIDLRVTDIFPLIERITCKVRVSQLPSFAGTGPIEDTVCLGEFTNLIGGVTATDTVGIDIPLGEFQIGGIFAGLTQLPDGSGAQYSTSIGIAGFDTSTVITDASDIDQLCIDIEHSYLGDLEISLMCPNGTTVSLVNANQLAIGMTPGGCGSGIGTFLGNDTNIDGGPPGSPVWTYCFSEVNATLGTMCDENNLNSNWVVNDYGFNSMNPNGVYLPDESFNGLIGCPVNGSWTIIVQDNQGIDDGYIFQWGIFFNASLYPDLEGYQNIVVSEDWLADPTIISGQNDTLLVIQPNVPGQYGYTYFITDDFGCDYDTTVYLEVLPQPEIFNDTIGCDLGFISADVTSYAGGVWSSADPEVTFFPDTTVDNPTIIASTPGVYTVMYIDNACGVELTAEIDYPPYPSTWLDDTTICEGSSYNIIAPNDNVHTTTYEWSNGDTGTNITVAGPGQYILTMTNICHINYDTITIDWKLCDIEAPNVIS
ncbi:MAG: proprotein convertase P-domain-containing protein, partial [Crocinitomicaceae bacterium]|nr:proprotein convertase P-domain-containing protein [Crocinitomicaceae bacterium]